MNHDFLPAPSALWETIQEITNRIFEDILAGRVTAESIIFVLVFFGLFLGFTTAAYMYSGKPKKMLTDQPVTWVTGYRRIMELLDSAVTQRSKIRVSFHRDLGGARSTDGTLVEATKAGLTLELSSIKTINPAWVGRSLELSFRLRLPENPKVQSTFGFISDILSYQQLDDEVLELKLSRPLRLELNQNRQHLRVEPPDKYVRVFKLWPEDIARRKGDVKDPDTWGDPLYVSEQGGVQELELENISGGGLRVEIIPVALRAKMNKISLNQQYLAQLTLADPYLERYATHYVMLRVAKCYDDCESKSKLSLGMSFVMHGLPQEAPLTGLRWRGVNRDFGIQVLDDWAYELHLELYRNKGIG